MRSTREVKKKKEFVPNFLARNSYLGQVTKFFDRPCQEFIKPFLIQPNISCQNLILLILWKDNIVLFTKLYLHCGEGKE